MIHDQVAKMARTFIEEVQIRVRDKTGLFATWLPTDGMKIGAFGRIHKGRFHSEGNVQQLGVNFSEEINAAKRSKLGFSDRAHFAVKTDLNSSGATIAGVKCEIILEGKGAFAYQLQDLVFRQVENKQNFYRDLVYLILSRQIRWDDDFVVIDAVRDAGSATILISESDSASVIFNGDLSSELENDAPLASIKGRVSVQVAHGSVFRTVCAKSITPLYSPRRFSFKSEEDGQGAIQMMTSWFKDKFASESIKPDQIIVTDFISKGDEELVMFRNEVTNETFTLSSLRLSAFDFLDSGGGPRGGGTNNIDRDFSSTALVSTQVMKSINAMRKSK